MGNIQNFDCEKTKIKKSIPFAGDRYKCYKNDKGPYKSIEECKKQCPKINILKLIERIEKLYLNVELIWKTKTKTNSLPKEKYNNIKQILQNLKDCFSKEEKCGSHLINNLFEAHQEISNFFFNSIEELQVLGEYNKHYIKINLFLRQIADSIKRLKKITRKPLEEILLKQPKIPVELEKSKPKYSQLTGEYKEDENNVVEQLKKPKYGQLDTDSFDQLEIPTHFKLTGEYKEDENNVVKKLEKPKYGQLDTDVFDQLEIPTHLKLTEEYKEDENNVVEQLKIPPSYTPRFLNQIFYLCRVDNFYNIIYNLYFYMYDNEDFEEIIELVNKRIYSHETAEDWVCSLEEQVNLNVNEMFYEINSNISLEKLKICLSDLKDFYIDFNNLLKNWNFLERSEKSLKATIEMMRQQRDNFMKALVTLERKPLNQLDVKSNVLEFKPIFDMFELLGIKPSSPIFIDEAFRKHLYLLEDYYYKNKNNEKEKPALKSEKLFYKYWFTVPISKIINIAQKIARYGIMINLNTNSIVFDSNTEDSITRLIKMYKKDREEEEKKEYQNKTFEEIAQKMVNESFKFYEKEEKFTYSKYLYVPPLIDVKYLLNWYLAQRAVYSESQSLYNIIIDQERLKLMCQIYKLDLEGFRKVLIRVVLCCFATGKLFKREDVYDAAIQIAETNNPNEQEIFDVHLWDQSTRLTTEMFYQELISKKVGKYPSRFFTKSSVKKQFNISGTISGGFIFPLVRFTFDMAKSKLNEFREYYSNLFFQITSNISNFLITKYSTIANSQAYFEEDARKKSLEMSLEIFKKLAKPESKSSESEVMEVVQETLKKVVGGENII